MGEVLQNDPTAYGFDVSQVNGFVLATNAFIGKLNDSDAAKAAAKAAVADKNAHREEIVGLTREFAKLIQANPAVTPSMKERAGLPGHNNPPSPVIPSAPQDLSATGYQTGVNELKWKRGSNKPGTTYMIQSRMSESAPWTLVDTTTKTKYRHTNQPVGQTQYYRVIAKRAQGESDPSNVAIAYGNGQTVVLQIAA